MINHSQNINIQEDSNLKKIYELLLRHYKLFIFSVTSVLIIAFLVNRYSVPTYKISSSILIKEENNQQISGDINDYLNSSLFGRDVNFQNELWVLKSTPVIENTINNLDLSVTYFKKGRIQSYDTYKENPFKISYISDHPQPLNVMFSITFIGRDSFQLKAEAKRAMFYNFKTDRITHQKDHWIFVKTGSFGKLIENQDMAFIVEPADTSLLDFRKGISTYKFNFRSIISLRNEMRENLTYRIVDRAATVIELTMKSESLLKGMDVINELMNVYSQQNLDRKNHTASITIAYIEKQLDDISDSLSRTEDNLQSFRSAYQLLNITDQASEISQQYMNLQNQMAELVSRKRYYDYVIESLMNDNFSNMMLPAAIGISDQLLNGLMGELITAQAQRSNLLLNKQERNPIVQTLGIKIDNLKQTISDNISAVSKTTSISIEEMNKRIKRTESEISRLPATQRQLGIIERKYRLNDAIYNYLMEKHAEAKITQASNLPDDIVIEPANLVGNGPITPNKPMNYILGFIIGIALPLGFLMIKNSLNNKIQSQDEVERLTSVPVLGKIIHNSSKTNNIMFEFPRSNIAESFRSLRTNLDFYVRGDFKKVIMVTSCLEGEGKSFSSLNIAMSYAQLGRRTILLDFDLRKPKTYFTEKADSRIGLSSYFIGKCEIKDMILNSPHEKLDYIPSGALPPNPSELISLDKTSKLILKLKEEYDIVVLDTTPLAQVTDAYNLIDHSDIKVVIIRQNYTLKSVLTLILKDLNHKNIRNICLVLNDNRYYQDQYGYGYGYYNKKGIFKNKIRRSNIRLA